MKKKSITKNYIYNLIYQILIMIVPLITTPYLSRVLGVENIGIYGYTVSITTYFILFGSLGIAMYAQREIAYVQDNKYERSKIFLEILFMRFITIGISIIIFYCTFVLHGEYKTYYGILTLEIVANALDISWFFQGLEEFKKTVLRNTIVKLISVLSIFSLVKTSNDLYKYFLIYVMSTLLGNLSLWLYLPKYIEKVKFRKLNIFKHFKPTLQLFIPQIAIQIYTVLDKTMIGIIAYDKSEVGFYEQAQKIVKLLLALSTAFGTVMIPRMANTFAKGEIDKLKKYMINSSRVILMLAIPLMFGIISISSKFVPLFYGEGYDKVIPLIGISSPIIVIIGLSNLIGTQYLLTTKQQKKFTISVITGCLVNLILNSIFIKLWNSIGAAISTVIAESTVTCVQLLMVKKNIPIKDMFMVNIKYWLAGIIMFIISIIINGINKWNLNDAIFIIIQTTVGICVYFGVLVITKDKIVINVLEILLKKINIIK